MRPKPQALGKPPVCGVVAPVGTVPLSHALVTITFKGRMTRVDIDRRCTTPGRRAREVGGRAPFSSLGEEAAQQRDGAAGTPLPDPHRRMCRLTAARLTNVFGRSQSVQTPPDGIASLSPARTGLDQGVTGERPTWLRTLRSSDLVRRVAVVDRLKLCLLVMASGLASKIHRASRS